MRNQAKSTRTGQLYKKGSTFRWTTLFSITIQSFCVSNSRLIVFIDRFSRQSDRKLRFSWDLFWIEAKDFFFFKCTEVDLSQSGEFFLICSRRWIWNGEKSIRQLFPEGLEVSFWAKLVKYCFSGTVGVTNRLWCFSSFFVRSIVCSVTPVFRRLGWVTSGGLGIISAPRGSPSVCCSSSWCTFSMFFIREDEIFDWWGMLSVTRWIVLRIEAHSIVEERMGRFGGRILMNGNGSNGVVVWVLLSFVLCMWKLIVSSDKYSGFSLRQRNERSYRRWNEITMSGVR